MERRGDVAEARGSEGVSQAQGGMQKKESGFRTQILGKWCSVVQGRRDRKGRRALKDCRRIAEGLLGKQILARPKSSRDQPG